MVIQTHCLFAALRFTIIIFVRSLAEVENGRMIDDREGGGVEFGE